MGTPEELIAMIEEYRSAFDKRDWCSQGFILYAHSITCIKDLQSKLSAKDAELAEARADAASWQSQCEDRVTDVLRLGEDAERFQWCIYQNGDDLSNFFWNVEADSPEEWQIKIRAAIDAARSTKEKQNDSHN